jgi:polar amino acid transport system substrate-binding protein
MKKIIIGILCLFMLTACGKKEKLVLVTEAGFAPYEYYDNGEIVGVDIDIANEIAKSLDMELEIKDVYFDSIINEVKTGKSDFGAAGISYTEERAKEVDFSIDYMVSRQIMIVKNDSNITGPSDLTNQKIAVQLGSVADSYITNELPNVTIVREKKFLAAIQDLMDNKVDCVVMDELPAKELINDNLKILPEALVIDHYGMIVSKENTELLNQINEVITNLKESGKIDEYMLVHTGLKEKEKEVDLGNDILNKFYYSVIYDARYKFILEGLKNTLLIALGAVIVGIIIGVTIAITRNIHDTTGKLKILNYLAKSYVNIIRGTPSTLQLMIIYYVIFKSTSVSIVLVGIIAFGINSGAYVAEIVRAGINSVSKGQKEAGYALGLHYKDIMKYIVIPSAVKNILPALGNEFITLIKETSIGAYIGIVELTKASDIIASRTYDYFFPLIIIALIYLCITFALTKVFDRIERKMNHARS